MEATGTVQVEDEALNCSSGEGRGGRRGEVEKVVMTGLDEPLRVEDAGDGSEGGRRGSGFCLGQQEHNGEIS